MSVSAGVVIRPTRTYASAVVASPRAQAVLRVRFEHLFVFTTTLGLTLLAMWPTLQQTPFEASVAGLSSISVSLLGFPLLKRPSTRLPGIVLLILGPLWTGQWAAGWSTGPGAFLATISAGFVVVLGGFGTLSYPKRSVPFRWKAATLGLLGTGLLLQIAVDLSSEAAWNGYSSSAWWPHLFGNRSTFNVLATLGVVDAVATAACYLLATVVQMRRLPNLETSIPLS